MDDSGPRFKRVLLKLSGEALLGEGSYGISTKILDDIAKELAATCKLGVEVAVVVGGGNIFRGVSSSAEGMDRSAADYMGMLATMMNSIALQNACERHGLPTRVQSAIEMQVVAEPFIPRRATRHLEKGRLVIFGAGTGNPYFTTDTAAALRAMEIQAEVLFKATKVDGVYDKDPVKHTDARRYDAVSFNDALKDDIKVMDSTAFALCKDNQLPVVVFDVRKPGNIQAALTGQAVGTRIEHDETTRFA